MLPSGLALKRAYPHAMVSEPPAGDEGEFCSGAGVRDLSKHFRFLWRFNAVVVAVIGFALIVAFVANMVSPLWSGRSAQTTGTFAPPKNAEHGYTYKLGADVIRLAGTSEALFILRRWKGAAHEADATGAEPGAQDVNLLAVNGNSAAGHWLLRGTNQRILSRDELHTSDGANYNEASPVMALVLTVAEPDRDSAGKERESLYFYHVGGGGNAVRFFTADRILAGQQVGADSYLVIYKDGETAGTDLFSLVDFRLLSSKPLPDIPD